MNRKWNASNACNLSIKNRPQWTVIHENGLCSQESGTTAILTFAQCFPNKYTCNSGHCISIDSRCDIGMYLEISKCICSR